MHKIYGIDDSVHECDCCGKKNLKSTVVVEIDGEFLHYGSVCATRHTGKDSKTIKREADAAYAGRLDAAMREFRSSTEHLAYEAAIAKAHRDRIQPGLPFREATRAAHAAANAKSIELARKYDIRLLSA